MRRFASLRRQGDFARVRARGRRTATPNLTIFCEPAPRQEKSLVGITVSKSVGGAVVRNLVKRRLLACLDGLLDGKPLARIVITARPSAAAASYQQLCGEVAKALP